MPGLRLEGAATGCQPCQFCRCGRQSSRRGGRPFGGRQIVSFRDLLHRYTSRTFPFILAGRPKTPICGVALILRHCGGRKVLPHSSGFRAPCIWTFLAGLLERAFGTGDSTRGPTPPDIRTFLTGLQESTFSPGCWARRGNHANQTASWWIIRAGGRGVFRFVDRGHWRPSRRIQSEQDGEKRSER